MTLRNLSQDEMPREKLCRLGADSLSDAELLAIALRTGTKKVDVLTLSRQLLQDNNGLYGLLQMPMKEFCAQHGLGVSKFVQLHAAIGMAKRILQHQLERGESIDSPEKAIEYIRLQLTTEQREVFGCMFLDSKHRMLEFNRLFYGDLGSAHIYVGELMRQALSKRASAIIICHNHPSGEPEPSQQDNKITEKIQMAAKLLDIQLLDHLIVGTDRVYSYATHGKL